MITKQRIKEIWEFVFYPKAYRMRQSIEIRQRLEDQKEQLEEEFLDKVGMLVWHNDLKGVCDPNSTPVLIVPVKGVDLNECSNIPLHTLYDNKRLDKNMINTSFSNSSTNAKFLQLRAGREIAKLLIESGFLKSRVSNCGRLIEFYINVYK